MAGEGRPTDCTPAVTARMADALAKGRCVRAACRLSGISHTSHYEWIKRAEAGDGPPFADYAAATRKAEAIGEDRHLGNIEAAAGTDAEPGDWRASAWLLERRHPEDYGKQRMEISGPDGGPVQVQSLAAEIAAQLATVSDKEVGIPDDL